LQLYYFDLFNLERYAAQICRFDSNFYCQNYIIEQDLVETDQFNMRLMIQNNMNKEIYLNQTTLLDANGDEIVCDRVNLNCRFNDTGVYVTASPSNMPFTIVDATKEWTKTKVCLLNFTSCDKQVLPGLKQEVNVRLNFSGVGKSTTHTSFGLVFANVE